MDVDVSLEAAAPDDIITAGAIEQAKFRLRQLQRTFDSVLDVLADMHRDEDWRYLTDASGNPYASFTAMLVGEMQMSDSWARRQQQVIQMVLPLRELTHPDARIPITAADVVALGQRGTEHVRVHAPDVLAGVEDPREQERALRGLIESTRRSMAGHLRDDEDDDAPADSDGGGEQSAQQPVHAASHGDSDDEPPWEVEDGDAPPSTRAAQDFSGGDDAATAGRTSPDSVQASVADDELNPDFQHGDQPDADRVTIVAAEEPDSSSDDTARVAQEALSAIAEGADPYSAAVKLLSVPVPATVVVDVDSDTVTAAMLQLTQMRSQLLAAQRPATTRRRRYGAGVKQ